MIRVTPTHLVLFLAGFATILVGKAILPAEIGPWLGACGILLCIAAIWLEHRSNDEVAQRFAFNSFAAGFAGMAIASLFGERSPELPAIWIIGFATFLLAYAFQWLRSLW